MMKMKKVLLFIFIITTIIVSCEEKFVRKNIVSRIIDDKKVTLVKDSNIRIYRGVALEVNIKEQAYDSIFKMEDLFIKDTDTTCIIKNTDVFRKLYQIPEFENEEVAKDWAINFAFELNLLDESIIYVIPFIL